MESEIALSLGVAVNTIVVILATILNLRVQTAVIQGRSDLGKGISIIGYTYLGLGILCWIVGVIFLSHKFPAWATLVSAGSILLFSVGIPLIIQGARLTEAR